MVIEQLLRGLHDFLLEKGVSFYVMFGTLLGARRDGVIIPWTSDLDVVVEAEFTHVLERIHEWNETIYFWMENRHIG
jgi:phosphorylcholine metabolism protein LicD